MLIHSCLKQKGIVDLVITVMQDRKKEHSKTLLIQGTGDKKRALFHAVSNDLFFHCKRISYVVAGTDICKL